MQRFLKIGCTSLTKSIFVDGFSAVRAIAAKHVCSAIANIASLINLAGGDLKNDSKPVVILNRDLKGEFARPTRRS